jgi:hypothetical protein
MVPTDRATAHTARASMSVLREMFPQHFISSGIDVPWPVHSPDLSACDYFLWGCLKSKVFISKPTAIEELKQRIKEEIRTDDLLSDGKSLRKFGVVFEKWWGDI